MQDCIQPQYEKNFRCIGSQCEDTCCRGWSVVIDKATYHRYQSGPELQPLLNHLVLINPTPSDFSYAQIRLDESLSCPFLEPDQLCRIQKQHGAEALSKTCAEYPRMVKIIDGQIEKPLALSCPEAARLVLLNPALVPSTQDTEDGPARYQRFCRLGYQAPRVAGDHQQFFWEIRSFALLLLHDRGYPLWERLFIFGMFCKRLHEVTSARHIELIPRLLADYAEIAAAGRLRPSMDRIPVQLVAQLRAVLEVLQRLEVSATPGQTRLQECLQDFKHGIGYRQDAPTEELVPAYMEACDRYYLPLIGQYPFIAENYLSNYIFRTRFPFGLNAQNEECDPKTDYLLMCLQYAVIKGLLIGMAGHYRETFCTDHVVKLIQSFAKKAEHSVSFLHGVNNDLTTPIGMAALLKN